MNKPKINEDPKDTLIREYQDEITRLKALLAGKGGAAGLTESQLAQMGLNPAIMAGLTGG